MDFTRSRLGLRTTLGLAAVPAFATALAIAAGAPAGAHAQDPVVEPSPLPPGHVPIIVDTPPEPPPSVTQPWGPPLPSMSDEDAYRYAALQHDALRSRKFLIGSSVATALGAALAFPAEATQCSDTDPDGEATLDRCSPGGKAMVVIGYPLLIVGGIAMLGSGIALGISKGKLRRLEQRASRRKTRALRWDPASSGFVF
jgi:hypothetical protein